MVSGSLVISFVMLLLVVLNVQQNNWIFKRSDVTPAVLCDPLPSEKKIGERGGLELEEIGGK